MAVRTILQLGDPKLREVCPPVQIAADAGGVVQDLADTLAHSRATTGYGRAIAAPQVGAMARVIFLQVPGLESWPLINPEIVWRSPETMVVWDACLSFLCIFMQVERHREIKVRYQDLHGEWQETHAGVEHDLSELLQHEIDHLDGILCIDRVTDLKSVCTREEFEKRYRDSSPYATTPSRS
jgi:peptide deformylase